MNRQDSLPWLSTDQMREVDRAMIEDYGIQLVQMMENAGRNLARLAASRFLNGDPKNATIFVLTGAGGNGGGGLVCARHLHNWGARVSVWTPGKALGEVPTHQLSILGRMGVSLLEAGADAPLPPADLVIDAVIGYSLKGAPTGTAASLIRAANTHSAPILALDVPSGVDADTGTVYDPAIDATATMTLALPKRGLRVRQAKQCVGELYLADISVPPEVYQNPTLRLDVGSLFSRDEIVRIW